MPTAAHDLAVFDHETEAPRGRRRPAPDWGGDDLFDHVPRRRFSHSADGSQARRRSHEPVTATAAPARPAPVEELVAARRAEYEQPAAVPAGRRTVTITGRPGPAFAPRIAGPARSRGPRTVEERIGSRPDRIAGWAFALGVLLILLALLV
ncbi:MAG: hypothetical protein M3P50_08880 [Actinomycetota bacterium]|nr:hypothetical protein [Actinomycetota bacterium]